MFKIIRQATKSDIEKITASYEEHFSYEETHGAYTVFKRGVYPTEEDALQSLADGSLYVLEEDGEVCASAIIDSRQPDEYKNVKWKIDAPNERIAVIHLLLVRPSMAGRGAGTALVTFAEELARSKGCTALRLDTGKQNLPAVSLYTKCGFEIVAEKPMRVGGAIEHSGHLFLEKLL